MQNDASVAVSEPSSLLHRYPVCVGTVTCVHSKSSILIDHNYVNPAAGVIASPVFYLSDFTYHHSLSNRTPPRYVRWPWPGCWWSCPPSSSWLHRPSSPWASQHPSCTISSSTAATPTSSCYATLSTWNWVWSTAAASTSSSTSWGRQGFVRNWQDIRVLDFSSTKRQKWIKRVCLWTQWQQDHQLRIA